MSYTDCKAPFDNVKKVYTLYSLLQLRVLALALTVDYWILAQNLYLAYFSRTRADLGSVVHIMYVAHRIYDSYCYGR